MSDQIPTQGKNVGTNPNSGKKCQPRLNTNLEKYVWLNCTFEKICQIKSKIKENMSAQIKIQVRYRKNPNSNQIGYIALQIY